MAKEKHAWFRIDVVIAVFAVLIITVVGTVLLIADRAEQAVIITPETEYIENLKSDELYASSVININTASKEELMFLKGIGEVRADAIITYRQKHSFQTKKDIMKIEGIGQKTYEAIADKICVE